MALAPHPSGAKGYPRMGSPNGLWTSVSGGMAQSQQIDIISNNIANSNTVGYKKDEATFKEYLTAVEQPPSPIIDIPRTAFKDSDFYHHDGRENAMVNLDKVHTDMSQGHFRQTNAPFDLAIDGSGFFPIQTAQGMLFTRAGDFKMNAQGQIVTNDGHPLLGLSAEALEAIEAARAAREQQLEQQKQNNPTATVPVPTETAAVANPFATKSDRLPAQEATTAATTLKPILIGENNGKITIKPSGKIYSGETLIGAVITAEFPDTKALKKVSSTMYANVDAANVPEPGRESKIYQGLLEESNVNTIAELTNLIKANRTFEGSMRAIRIYNDMAGKEANEVGKL